MKPRRALSTVVGAVFAIIALTSTVTYVSYSMGILDNYNQSVLTKNQQLSDVNKEKFQISSITVPNSKLNITIVNTGSIPINFTKIWVQNTTTTAAKDWVKSYVPTQSFVTPGGVLTNIGQSVNIIPSNSYNVKLVTSRGNTQQFALNSVSSVPIGIQLFAIPATVPSDFTTELVMIVTNNQTSTLTNISPQISKTSSTAACTPSATATPASVSTLTPGSTAVFKWDVKLTGKDSQFCTYQASLQNGFPGNTASATATVNSITATSSNWSTTWGIISINYTSLRWAQNGGTNWNSNWAIPCGGGCGSTDVWKMDITNNDPTRPFIINGNTTVVVFGTSPGSNAATQFYIIKNDYAPMHNYPTNGQTIPANSTATLYFGAGTAGQHDSQSISKTGQYAVSILIYGYWTTVQTNNFFGQNIPYEGIIVS